MSLPARAKQRLFLQLAQLVRAGTGLPQAAEKLARTSGGPERQAAKRLHRLLEKGATAGEAFANLSPLEAMERSCLSSAARTGRLDFTLQRLGEYFGVIDRARSEIKRHTAYPIFLLHFGLLATNLPLLMSQGWPAFLKVVGGVLLWLYAAVLAFFILTPIAEEAGATSRLADWLLRSVPLFGAIRRDLAVARFFGTYDMQLEAGVNVIDGVLSAAQASRSGLLIKAVKGALPALRAGEPVGPQLARSRGALPREAEGALILAEETGELHRTLPQLQEQYEKDGLHRLAIATEWIPRLIYLAVAAYTGYRIVSFYKGYMGDMMRQIDSL